MSHDNAPRWNLRVPHAPSTREVIRAKTSRMLRATISTSEGMFFKLNSRLDDFKQHSLMTIRTQIRGRQMEVRLPSPPREAPRLCRGGSESLTYREVVHRR